eukprot:GEMP01007867.1.p1 GENE.GEMP01007867.1~~GEMP01007867.1.p1  ORF type:complete len:966 (+),score=173.76 GEMP01007867.1:104-3001(+)
MENRDNAYSSEEILEATNQLDNKLGEGLQGAVYRGILRDGTEVAIKALGVVEQDLLEAFETEVRVGCNWRHPNLCILMGYSVKDRECFLVYEYLAGGDVARRLAMSDTVPFTGEQRLQVLLDTALALSYLLNSKPRVYHRDIKTPNILLDKNGTAKMGDFGLSCLSKRSSSLQVKNTAGTVGYADPEYVRTSIVTEYTEIYSWCMVALELLTGNPPAIQSASGVDYLMSRIQGVGSILAMLDQRAQWAPNTAHAVAELAIRCAGPTKQRPSFIEIVKNLRYLQQSSSSMAPSPRLSWPSAPPLPLQNRYYPNSHHEFQQHYPIDHYNQGARYRSNSGYQTVAGEFTFEDNNYSHATVVTNHASVVRDQHPLPSHHYPQHPSLQQHQQRQRQHHPQLQQQTPYTSPEPSPYYPRHPTPPPIQQHHQQHLAPSAYPNSPSLHPMRDLCDSSYNYSGDYHRESAHLDPAAIQLPPRTHSHSPRASTNYHYDASHHQQPASHQRLLFPGYVMPRQGNVSISPRQYPDDAALNYRRASDAKQLTVPAYGTYEECRDNTSPIRHQVNPNALTGNEYISVQHTRQSNIDQHFYRDQQTRRSPTPQSHPRGWDNASQHHNQDAYGATYAPQNSESYSESKQQYIWTSNDGYWADPSECMARHHLAPDAHAYVHTEITDRSMQNAAYAYKADVVADSAPFPVRGSGPPLHRNSYGLAADQQQHARPHSIPATDQQRQQAHSIPATDQQRQQAHSIPATDQKRHQVHSKSLPHSNPYRPALERQQSSVQTSPDDHHSSSYSALSAERLGASRAYTSLDSPVGAFNEHARAEASVSPFRKRPTFTVDDQMMPDLKGNDYDTVGPLPDSRPNYERASRRAQTLPNGHNVNPDPDCDKLACTMHQPLQTQPVMSPGVLAPHSAQRPSPIPVVARQHNPHMHTVGASLLHAHGNLSPLHVHRAGTGLDDNSNSDSDSSE